MQALAKNREIDGLAGSVDDEPQLPVGAGRTRDHQIVDNPSALVEQLRVALTSRREIDEVCGA